LYQLQFKFRWRKGQNEARCSEVFKNIAVARYNNVLSKARKDATKNSESTDPEKWKEHPPDWCEPEYWTGMCDKWNTEKWKKKSKQNSANRRKAGIRVYHRHGSANSNTIRRKMDAKIVFASTKRMPKTNTYTRR
jgi:Plant transposase (Ptta/En/Spm family)